MEEPYFEKYLRKVPVGSDPNLRLKEQLEIFRTWLRSIPEDRTLDIHQPYTWTFREVVKHLSDCERVFAFRALWIARGEIEPASSFDESRFSREAQARCCRWYDLVDEFEHVRSATMSLFQTMPSAAWQRCGIAAGYQVDVEMLCAMIYGHVAHHEAILRTRWKTYVLSHENE